MALFIATLCLTSVAAICGRAKPSRVRSYLDHLSAGRLLTRHLQVAEDSDSPWSTKQWIDKFGVVQVELGLHAMKDGNKHGTAEYSPIVSAEGRDRRSDSKVT